MKFTKKFKEKVKTSRQIMVLALELGVSYYTIIRWLDLNKCEELTKMKHQAKLCSVTGLLESEIFDKDE